LVGALFLVCGMRLNPRHASVPGKAFDRRRWRIKGERFGAAVDDWQGGYPPQTKAGTARGVAKQLRAIYLIGGV